MRLSEAKRPSNVNLKANSRTVQNQYLVGDIYDFHSGTYTKEDTYVDHDGNGYITDKTGREYPVKASITTGDAGRIAGGSTNYYVTIYFPGVEGPNGKEAYYHISGYMAIFSNPHNTGIVSDLQEGYYLEDYMAKYGKSYESNLPDELYDELVSRADADAISYNAQRRASAERRNAYKASKNEEKYNFEPFAKKGAYPTFVYVIENGQWKIDSYSWNADWNEAFINFIESRKITCGRPLSDFEGLSVEVCFSGGLGESKFGIDRATNQIKQLLVKKNKYGGKSYEESEPSIMHIRRKHINETPYGKAVCKYFQTHKNEIENADKYIYTFWNDYRNEPLFRSEKGKYVIYEYTDRSQIDGYTAVEKKVLNKICELFPQSLQELKGLNRRAADFNVDRGYKGSLNASEAEAKMTAWHNGERKQNVRSCSDAKLQAYYKICKRLGYEDEASKLKAEADSRGMTLTERRRR